MSSDPTRAKSIFLNAADRPAGPEREAFLAEACATDTELRREVDELLVHFEQVGSFLDSPAAPTAAAAVRRCASAAASTPCPPACASRARGRGG